VPNVVNKAPKGDTLASFSDIKKLIKDPQLARLNAGVLLLHLTLTTIFVVLPSQLIKDGLVADNHWHLYIPVLFLAFLLMVPIMIIAIKKEKELLDVLTTRADYIIDTSELSVHQLAESIREKILGKKDKQLIITFESFGFKYGIPKEADYVFDARFLPNPHWEPELKPLTGLDQPVKDYLANHSIVQKFTWQIQTFIQTWLPHLERNNRSYLTIAIGCTGGQHRSVYLAQTIGDSFLATHPNVKIRHREQEK
jgi:hypothetical protein